jgi:hypothetical protein
MLMSLAEVGRRAAFRPVPMLGRFAAALMLASGLIMPAACSTQPEPAEIDPASLGFQPLYMCPNKDDVITIGRRDTADKCLAACEEVSKTMLNGAAKGCWWQDGRAGLPRDCRVCKTTAPVKDIYINNWAMPLPAAAGSNAP